MHFPISKGHILPSLNFKGPKENNVPTHKISSKSMFFFCSNKTYPSGSYLFYKKKKEKLSTATS